MVLGVEMLVLLGTVKTPGLSHRQNNDFFLETSSVNSLLGVGSGNRLNFTWDLLSFLCQQLSPSTQPGRGLFPERPARWPRGRCVSHQPVKGCLPYAIPELPAAQLESTPAASRLGTQGEHRVPCPSTKASPLRLLPEGEEEEAGLGLV